MRDLTGKVAIVTGASQGMGKSIAEKLALAGAQVVLIARSRILLKNVAESINSNGGKSEFKVCDVTNYSAVNKVVNYCVATYGKLDIVVNNAGVIDPISRLSDSDPGAWGKAIDINVKGVYHGLRASVPVMEKQGFGTVVNLSSGAATRPLEGWSHYCASKAAVKLLTESVHQESGQKGVRVIGLSPGGVQTTMMKKIIKSGMNPVSQIDWKDHIKPEWVGDAVVFLCTSEADAFVGKEFSLKTKEGRDLVFGVATSL